GFERAGQFLFRIPRAVADRCTDVRQLASGVSERVARPILHALWLGRGTRRAREVIAARAATFIRQRAAAREFVCSGLALTTLQSTVVSVVALHDSSRVCHERF